MQQEAAEQVGVCRNTYWAFEVREYERLPYDALEKLTQFCGVSVADLLPAARR